MRSSGAAGHTDHKASKFSGHSETCTWLMRSERLLARGSSARLDISGQAYDSIRNTTEIGAGWRFAWSGRWLVAPRIGDGPSARTCGGMQALWRPTCTRRNLCAGLLEKFPCRRTGTLARLVKASLAKIGIKKRKKKEKHKKEPATVGTMPGGRRVLLENHVKHFR